MHIFFYKIHLWIQKNKAFALIAAFVFLGITAFFASQIKFEEDITRIIPKNEKTNVTSKILQQLNFTDKIAVIIEKDSLGNVDDLTQVANQFLDTIPVADAYIKNIQGHFDEDFITHSFAFTNENLPMFLDASDYKQIENKLQKDSIALKVSQNYEALTSPSSIVTKDFIVNDPLGISFIALKKLQNFNGNSDFILKDGFLLTKDESKLLLFINPKLSGSETEQNTKFSEILYGIQSQLNQEYKNKVTVDYFGSSLIAVANAKQIKTDILTTVAVSMTALMLLLVLFYRKILIPIIIFLPSVFGAFAALCFLYFYKDSISAISLSIGAVLLGITIDYALHILTHYKATSDVKSLYKEITKPLLMSSSTTAVAFICLLFVNSDALKDLGIFAAIAVMFSAFFSLLIIPHLYKPSKNELKESSIIDKLAGYSFHSSKVLLAISLILIGISFFTFGKVSFDDDLSKINFIPKVLQASERKLEATSDETSKALYLVSHAASLDSLLQINSELYANLSDNKDKLNVLEIASVGKIVLSEKEQLQKIEKWNAFWDSNRIENLEKQLISEGAIYGFKPTTHQPFYDVLRKDFQPLKLTDYKELNPAFVDEFITEKDGFFTAATTVKIPEEKRDEFVALFNQDKNITVIDRQQMNETFLGELVSDFNNLINYSFLAVLIILWFFFKRIELVLISAIPIAITGFITAGLMGLFGIDFNIFSTIVCTLIFGHGVDFSIFMTSALQKEYTTGKNELQVYRTSILLAVLTTILAIGALIFAQHPALKSIAAVALIGVFSAVLITFVFYPILFKIVISNRPRKGKSPVSLILFLQTVVFFIYYAVFGILLSIVLRILLKILPVSKNKRFKIFGKAMSIFQYSVLHLKPTVKNRLINPNNENFKKQAIIISNHTSFLDTLAIGMYNPNIVYLINDWVYNSPIFGRAVRAAGFFPVSEGLDGNVDKLKERLGNDFSLMIFPEGTRSYSNEMLRFHKGAFFLADKLQLDILPIYIQGNSEIIPKGDFIIYDGQIMDYVDERITPNDERFGIGYAERTKKISKYCKAKFDEVRLQLENENYFRQKLFLSFLYKEEGIVKEVKSDFKKNKSAYHQLNLFIAKNEKLIHWANNYGQIDFLLTMQQANRNIQTVISDVEKGDIASTNYITKIRKITYFNQLNDVDETRKTLLISCDNALEIPNQIEKIIVLKINNYFTEFVNFNKVNETDQVIVFQKDSNEKV